MGRKLLDQLRFPCQHDLALGGFAIYGSSDLFAGVRFRQASRHVYFTLKVVLVACRSDMGFQVSKNSTGFIFRRRNVDPLSHAEFGTFSPAFCSKRKRK